MPLQKKLTYLLVVLTAVGIVAAVKLVPDNPGRAGVAVLVAGVFSWFVVARAAHARYCAVLKEASRDLELDYLATPDDEKRSPFLERMRTTADSDVFRWKIDGRFPALVGLYEGFTVAVRVPVGLDFDAGAPDSTRVAAYHEVKMTGFSVYDRTRVKKTPKGRQATFDDVAFNERFLVLAHRPEEAKAVLTPEIRAALLEAGGIGFRGVDVNRYGVFLYEEGKVSDAVVVRKRVALVTTLAKAAARLTGASAG